MALNKLLYDASVASTPKRLNGARKRSRIPVWNDTIAAAVRLSKLAHTEWKEAGSPTIATDLLLIKKKAAWRAMRQTIRLQNYLQMQEKCTELMLAKEMDTKIFYKRSFEIKQGVHQGASCLFYTTNCIIMISSTYWSP